MSVSWESVRGKTSSPVLEGVLVEYKFGKNKTRHNWFLKKVPDGTELLKVNGNLSKLLSGEVLRRFLAGKPIKHGGGTLTKLDSQQV